nr:hypothetical protein [Tanacetum cinerariifolium]
MKDGHMTPTDGSGCLEAQQLKAHDNMKENFVAVQTEVWENASMTLSKVESELTDDFCYKRRAELTGAKSNDCRISVAESFTTCFCKTWNVSGSVSSILSTNEPVWSFTVDELDS